MNASRNFFDRFKRITTSGNYLPELDGLRFIAIFMVVALFHLGGFYAGIMSGQKGTPDYILSVFARGYYGVPFFFILSGFSLSLPFAKQKLYGGKPVNIKQYILRRITRIEPLYIVTLVLYFIVRVWILKYQSFAFVAPHFVASMLYAHNFIFNSYPLINGVTWSLEVEIQFYILAPFLTSIYFIKNTFYRYLVFMLVIVSGSLFLLNLQLNHLGNIITWSCFFFAGMFLADLYLANKKTYNGAGYCIIALVALLFILLLAEPLFGIFHLVLLLLSMVFFFLALTNDILRKYLSKKIITAIGGMCYSIYLLHMGVFGILRHRLPYIQFTGYTWLNGLAGYLITIAVILIVSAVFFLLIEKPTMKKDWYKNFFRKTRLV